MTPWRAAREMLQDELEAQGFEVLGAVASGAYNDSLEDKLASYRLPALGDGEAVALVVGNTHKLWPLFLEAYAGTALAREPDPLDSYSRLHIARAAASVAARLDVAHHVRFSFDPPPHTVAIQRLAALAGAAELAPTGHARRLPDRPAGAVWRPAGPLPLPQGPPDARARRGSERGRALTRSGYTS